MGDAGSVYLVVKTRRRKPRAQNSNSNSDSNSKPKSNVQAEILGIVTSVLEFKGMCDFQFLPVQREPEKGREREKGREDEPSTSLASYSDLTHKLYPFDISSALSWFDNRSRSEMDEEAPYFFPPFVYSRYSKPNEYLMCKETEYRAARIKEKNKSGAIGLNLRAERKAFTITVLGTDPRFPQGPTQAAIKDADARCKHPRPHQLLRDMFDERPLWTRNAVQAKTGIEDSMLK